MTIVHFQLHVRMNLTFLGLPSLLLKKIEKKSCQETTSLRIIGGVDRCLFLTSQTWAIMFKAFGPKGGLMEQQGYCDPPMHHTSETTLMNYDSLVNEPQHILLLPTSPTSPSSHYLGNYQVSKGRR